MIAGLIAVTLLAIAFLDARTYHIPDGLLVLLLMLAALWRETTRLEGLYQGLGLALGLTLLKWLVEKGLRRPALGWADIKLMACCGFLLPLSALGWFLMGAGLLALPCRVLSSGTYFPFAPAIVVSFFLVWGFFPEELAPPLGKGIHLCNG